MKLPVNIRFIKNNKTYIRRITTAANWYRLLAPCKNDSKQMLIAKSLWRNSTYGRFGDAV